MNPHRRFLVTLPTHAWFGFVAVVSTTLVVCLLGGTTNVTAQQSVVADFAREAQGVRVFWGESTVIDGALVASWALATAQESTLLAAGVTISLKLFENQPDEPGPGPAGAIASLQFPELVRQTSYLNHFELHSEPHGHGAPPGAVNPDRNSVPHFDFHFYAISEDEVRAILDLRPPLPAVPADRLPVGYLQPGRSVPEMGRHAYPASVLTDLAPLSIVMVAGYTAQAELMHFLEPMISREFLLRREDFTLPVPKPEVLGRASLYPTSFEATFHGNAYHFVFSDFVSVR